MERERLLKTVIFTDCELFYFSKGFFFFFLHVLAAILLVNTVPKILIICLT